MNFEFDVTGLFYAAVRAFFGLVLLSMEMGRSVDYINPIKVKYIMNYYIIILNFLISICEEVQF